jgi:hypothetical protein
LRLGIDLLQWVPSFRDTRRGRANARAMQVMALVAGLVLFVIVNNELRLLGVLVAALALVVPMPELKKRTLINNLRRKLEVDVVQSTPVEVVWDGKRLDVGREPRLRRVLTKPGGFDVTDGPIVLIKARSDKKSETIKFGAEPQVDVFAANPEDVTRLVAALKAVT